MIDAYSYSAQCGIRLCSQIAGFRTVYNKTIYTHVETQVYGR